MATFALIPGAGADPRVYQATIEALRKLGHDALAPPLPLHDQTARPSDHAQAVAQALPADRLGFSNREGNPHGRVMYFYEREL
jgi:hypothetical protein